MTELAFVQAAHLTQAGLVSCKSLRASIEEVDLRADGQVMPVGR